MDWRIGVAAALAAAWASVIGVSLARGAFDAEQLRLPGALALIVLSLSILGVNIPSWLGMVIVAIGLLGALRTTTKSPPAAPDGPEDMETVS